MRTQVSSHSGSSSIGECIAMFCQRGIMWAIQSIIVITEILPFIFGSIQSSVQRTSSLGECAMQIQATGSDNIIKIAFNGYSNTGTGPCASSKYAGYECTESTSRLQKLYDLYNGQTRNFSF